ncbi:EamA family transporter [Dyadobacter frigoris]|uniref:DMT family transporter n=1 Tax=Dyadobacter frigoris TaxID=2576211 RepID=A0A4U6D5R3_9BACT|nr:DMT family transporter [Dyadobacter frigoris]TKT89374.1 DMT family transporter [Dyadobacter frigoris]
MNIKKIEGAALIALGAASYGILATIVKFANNQGVHTSLLIFAQFSIGLFFLVCYSKIKDSGTNRTDNNDKNTKLKLLLFGTSLGLTSCFYYLSIRYIPVSVGIILLMQTIWMSIVWEAFSQKTTVSLSKIIGAVLIVAGTLLATNIFSQHVDLNWKGVGLGLLAACCYTISMHASNHVASNLDSHTRSKYLIAGGMIIVLLFWNTDIWLHFDWLAFLKWGAVLALFGTILPPLLFTKGMPMTGMALGGIIAAVEIPVSIFSAHLILGEAVSWLQWAGVALILGSVIVINLKTFYEPRISNAQITGKPKI